MPVASREVPARVRGPIESDQYDGQCDAEHIKDSHVVYDAHDDCETQVELGRGFQFFLEFQFVTYT